MIERCPTGINGFDRLCQGGFVRNSDNLVVGGPGSGKTTFLLEFLWNGATKFNENGLYCSFEPDVVEILKDGMIYGWDFTKLNNQGKIKFMRFAPQTSIDELKSELTKIISKNNIKRICFDPISVLAMNFGDIGKMRQIIFELSSLLKRLKVTSVLADESLEGGMGEDNSELVKTNVLRFLSDSVIIFYESNIAGAGDRALRIAKMRRTSHERNAVGMKITPRGIEVIDPSLVIKEIPSLEENKYIEEVQQQDIQDIQQPNQFPVTQNPQQYKENKEKNEQKNISVLNIQPPQQQDSEQQQNHPLLKKKKSLKPNTSQTKDLDKAKDFIKQTKLRGYSNRQIKDIFLQKGWNEEQIEKLFL